MSASIRYAIKICAGLVLVAVVGLMGFAGGRWTHREQRADWIVKQWSEIMHAYNIDPVYPPTEDVHVGDIFGIAEDLDPKSGELPEGGLFASAKIAYVPMTSELMNYYAKVAVFPETGPAPSSPNGVWEQLPAGTECDGTGCKSNNSKTPNIFSEAGTLVRLPLVALPNFSVSRSFDESAAVSLPARLMSVVFGETTASNQVESITIRAAETYGVPAGVALGELNSFCSPQKFSSIDCWQSTISAILGSLRNKPPTKTAVSIVYRLYLTRSIEYTFDTSSAIGAQAKAIASLENRIQENSNVTPETSKAGPVSPSSSAEAPNPGSAPNDAKTAANHLAALHASLDAQLKSLGHLAAGHTAPGGTFSVGAVSEAGVSLVQTFERPVVIGYRAITLPSIKN
ncbi:hypothetical protein FAZ69_31400 [Trinickia terrae]|uniref:Uncharacterized protein n=1 Tax=Trinickia terrae TaxID=2571161 RepID=A0A4U1HHF9_9BURK|nr:hypothetical protein [Trinickia terrae]TKC78947.1 hypothetical protein FAZ69_31400 [Trinickia terrae]